MNFVILGNGGAGTSALQTIRKNDTDSNITILSREQYPAYSPCSLPNLIAEEIDTSKIFRFDKQFYQQHNAIFLKNKEAVTIDPKNKKIILINGKKIGYDKLLIAAGASPIIPKNISGLEKQSVYIMGALKTTLDIQQQLQEGVDHAVIVGGGFMGVETAVMLRKRGVNVTLVEMLPNILSRMLDPDMSSKVADILKDHEIKLILQNSVTTIHGKEKVNNVSLSDKKIACDMVIVAIGVKPNIHIVQNSGIYVNHGIIVDSKMQTNIPDIYAAGDIAETYEKILGHQGSFAIWPNAIEQGRIAGLNMVGCQTEYAGAEIVNVLNIFDIPVIAMGYTSENMSKGSNIVRFTRQSAKKIFLQDNHIVGLQFIGTLKNVGIFYAFMKKKTDISSFQNQLLDDNFVITPDTS